MEKNSEKKVVVDGLTLKLLRKDENGSSRLLPTTSTDWAAQSVWNCLNIKKTATVSSRKQS